MPVQLVAGVNVGDVDLKDRSLENLQRVVHADRGEGVRGGIDDQGIGVGTRRLNKIDQHTLMVRLVKRQLHAGKGGKLLTRFLDRFKGGGPVDMRLSNAQQVQIWAIEDHDAHCCSFSREIAGKWLSYVPAAVIFRTISPARSPSRGRAPSGTGRRAARS